MSELINVCHAVRCPYSEKNGCNRYPTSTCCHLAYNQPGQVRQGFHTRASQYWLYADDSYNRIQTEHLQNQFLTQKSEIRRAKAIAKLQDHPYQVSWKK